MNARIAPALLGMLLTLGVAAPALAQDTPAQEEGLQQKIDRLIKELGADGYDAREKAQRELEGIGKPAVPALEKAAKSKDLEIASRAADALSKINKTRKPRPADDQPAPQRDPFRPPPPPDMDEVLKELEKQMPEGFGKIFRQFFPNGQDPQKQQPQGGQQDEERNGPVGGQSRVRTWTFTLGPNGRLEQQGAQKKQGVAGALGLTTGPASAALRAQLEIAAGEGRVVNRLSKGGWAEKHGIELYDVIVGVDGRPVRQTKDLEPLLEKGCKVEVFRKAKVQVLEVPKVVQADTTEEKKPAPAPKVEKDDQGRKQRSF